MRLVTTLGDVETIPPGPPLGSTNDPSRCAGPPPGYGHGGNTVTAQKVARVVSPQTQTRILVANWCSLVEEQTLEVFGEPGGHAGSNETADMQAIAR